jgi:apoptosis-inducing factor 3
VIVGGGAAGYAAAHAIRTSGWAGDISVFSADRDAPYDRTLLTKDYLDGHFGDDRLPIAHRGLEELGVSLQLGINVDALDAHDHVLRLTGGGIQRFSKLLLATGADPHKPDFPGADLPHVKCLRSLEDCRQIISAVKRASRVVVLGGSFISLEAAASIRSRGLTVDVISPEPHPLSKIVGRALSELVVQTHRDKGVQLHLGHKIAKVTTNMVTLDDGNVLECDLLVVGIGVEPRVELAKEAGLALDRGVVVDSQLRTSLPDIYAAGDIARWPDPHTNEAIRVEHWVVAERQGAIAGANMLGAATTFEMVPFFWTKHFDLAIRYVGHAQEWDEERCEGSVAERDVIIRYLKAGRELAVATVGRDLQSIQAEQEMMRRLAERRRACSAKLAANQHSSFR